MADSPSPVERKVDDSRCIITKDITRDALSGEGRCRNDKRVRGKLFEDRTGERTRSLRLTDRDAVQPDYRATVCLKRGQSSQPLAQTGHIFPVPECVHYESRQERDDAKSE